MLLTVIAATEELAVLEELLTLAIAEELLFATVLDTETDELLFTVVEVLEELFPTLELVPGTDETREEDLLELVPGVLEITLWAETLEALETPGSGVMLFDTDEVEPLEPTPPPPPHAPNNSVLLNIRATLKRLQTLADKCSVARALEKLNGRLFIANYLECRWWMT